MKKYKNEKKQKTLLYTRIIDAIILPIIISLLITGTLGGSFKPIFAAIGISKYQVETADEKRKNNEYDESITWYKKIANKNNSLSPYANLAIAEIYSHEIRNKDFTEANKYYKKSIDKTDDIQIYCAVANFIFEQINYIFKDETTLDSINVFERDNLRTAIQSLNYIGTKSDIFKNLDVDFPLDEHSFIKIFTKNTTININTSYWLYEDTIVSTDGGLAMVNGNYKLEYLYSYSEPVNPMSANVRVNYVYGKYNKKVKQQKKNALEAFIQALPQTEKIYLGDINEKD